MLNVETHPVVGFSVPIAEAAVECRLGLEMLAQGQLA